jgi:hypothetical protein
MKKIIIAMFALSILGCSSQSDNKGGLKDSTGIVRIGEKDTDGKTIKNIQVVDLVKEFSYEENPSLYKLQVFTNTKAHLALCENFSNEEVNFIKKELFLIDKNIQEVHNIEINAHYRSEYKILKDMMYYYYLERVTEESCKKTKEKVLMLG